MTNSKGQQFSAKLTTCEAYTLTTYTALQAAEALQHKKTLKRAVGVHTPSTLLGADFILQFEGVSRTANPEIELASLN